jgi:Predicted phosphatases
MYEAKYILFDLDGTITNPELGITNAYRAAITGLGLEMPSKAFLRSLIGPPLEDAFAKNLQLAETDVKVAVTYFRTYFETTGIEENVEYAGVELMLQTLKERGKELFIATSKPEVFAKRVIENFALTAYFSGIYGSNLDGTRSDKAEVIKYAIESADISAENAIMIGDREHDIIGAQRNSIPAIGVTYGFGAKEQLILSGAAQIVDSPLELLELLK